MKQLLVTGASGFLGWNICRHIQNAFEIFGVVNSKMVEIPGVSIIRLDLTSFRDMKEAFNNVRPDGVIHTAAASRPEFCETSPSESYKINVEATVNLAGLCSDRSIPFAFTSTDLVFDGRSAPYKENDPVNPVNVYGEQKAVAEVKVLDRFPEAVVCRMPMMFGVSSPAYQTFFQHTIRALREGKEITLFTDEFRTPVSGQTAALGLVLALQKTHNILHLGGRDRISRYDFGRLIASLIGCSTDNIIACKQEDIKLSAPRAADLTLDSSRAFALGFNPPPLKEDLQSQLNNLPA